MNINQLLNQFLGAQASPDVDSTQRWREAASSVSSGLGSGLAGGAAAGGIAALLVGSKKARKFAGTAATVGGAALLGGLAFKAFQSWRQQQGSGVTTSHRETAATYLPATRQSFEGAVARDDGFQLTLIKAMIAAANADGHIDAQEQERLFRAMDNMQVDQQTKGLILDLIRAPAEVQELARETRTLEQKSEVYLASCLAIDVDQASERQYLDALKTALGLPDGLAQALLQQAQQLNQEAA